MAGIAAPPPLAQVEADPDGDQPESQEGVAPPQAADKRGGFKAALFDVLETLLLTIVIYAVLSTFIGRYKVLSVSMKPTLHEGEYLLISKQTHKIWPLKRGDIIVFRYPRNLEKNYIKRLIGLPGETVELRGGKLYIDGELTPEPWLVSESRGPTGKWQLGEDEYFVMGDNRSNSSDSRTWGPIHSAHIIGKAIFRYWPPQAFGPIRHGPQPTAASKRAVPFESVLTSPLPAGTSP